MGFPASWCLALLDLIHAARGRLISWSDAAGVDQKKRTLNDPAKAVVVRYLPSGFDFETGVRSGGQGDA
jgi:hypothetical protein